MTSDRPAKTRPKYPKTGYELYYFILPNPTFLAHYAESLGTAWQADNSCFLRRTQKRRKENGMTGDRCLSIFRLACMENPPFSFRPFVSSGVYGCFVLLPLPTDALQWVDLKRQATSLLYAWLTCTYKLA